MIANAMPNMNNLYGDLIAPRGFFGRARGAAWVAKKLRQDGWHIHKQSWDDEWEASCDSAQIAMVRDGKSVLVRGEIVDFDDALSRFCELLKQNEIQFKLELYNKEGGLHAELMWP